MKSAYLLMIALIGAGLLAGCGRKEEPAPPSQTNETKSESVTDSDTTTDAATEIKAAPLEGLTYIKGDAVSSFEEGKVYVVEFWATWCPPCIQSIPHLTEIQNEFKNKGVTVIGITNETANIVKPFVEKMADEISYSVALDTQGTAGKKYMTAFGQRGIPTAFVVDGKGNVAWYGHPMDGLDTVLERLVSDELSAK